MYLNRSIQSAATDLQAADPTAHVQQPYSTRGKCRRLLAQSRPCPEPDAVHCAAVFRHHSSQNHPASLLEPNALAADVP